MFGMDDDGDGREGGDGGGKGATDPNGHSGVTDRQRRRLADSPTAALASVARRYFTHFPPSPANSERGSDNSTRPTPTSSPGPEPPPKPVDKPAKGKNGATRAPKTKKTGQSQKQAEAMPRKKVALFTSRVAGDDEPGSADGDDAAAEGSGLRGGAAHGPKPSPVKAATGASAVAPGPEPRLYAGSKLTEFITANPARALPDPSSQSPNAAVLATPAR